MGKILSLVIGLGVLGFVAYRSLYGRGGATAGGAPQQQLQNVKEASKRIENDQAKAAEEALKKATPTD